MDFVWDFKAKSGSHIRLNQSVTSLMRTDSKFQDCLLFINNLRTITFNLLWRVR